MSIKYKGWNSFSPFFSAENAQTYLKNAYKKLNFVQAEQKSYENCYPFMYYLEHGKLYYQQAENAPISIQPILLFYGLVHLIKASILTVAPEYPETTSVLAHGVSTRKRKKQQYRFMEDEVKFQKNGLFSFMAEKMFHMKQLEGEKATMGDVLKNIPELSSLFSELNGMQTFAAVQEENGRYTLSKNILDRYFMTENRFKDFVSAKSVTPISFIGNEKKHISFSAKLNEVPEPLPFKYNLEDAHISVPLVKANLLLFPELMLHYLLLYNLGMIARYETEWWSELIKMMPNEDFPFIQNFLQCTLRKGPYLIYQYLKYH